MQYSLLKDVIKTRNEGDRLILQHHVDKAIDRVARNLQTAIGEEIPVFLCVMKGGLLFTAELMKRVQSPLELDYIHVDRYRDETQGGSVRWHKEPDIDLNDRLVVLIDDIFDEGDTLRALIRYCEAQGAGKLLSVVLFKKNLKDKHTDVEPDFAGLEVPNRYVFGWGMDYRGFWRNLYDVYAVNRD